MSALILILIPVALYLFVRANPQRKRAMAQQALLKDLSPGDRVVTAGGMVGTLVGFEGEQAAVELAPGVIVEFLRPAIVRRLVETDAGADGEATEDGADPPDLSGGNVTVPDDLSGLAPPPPAPNVASTDPVAGSDGDGDDTVQPIVPRPGDAPSTSDPLGRRPEES
ncbi:MAG TPA: preprotein translocase subunit YajC [Acidimicrobiales bacterium]|jgi:preprotein translocase subunit YajC